MLLVGIAVFLSIVILATGFFSWGYMILILVCIAVALVLSFLRIRHLKHGDEEASCCYSLRNQMTEKRARPRFYTRGQAIFASLENIVLFAPTARTSPDLDRLAEQQTATETLAVLADTHLV
jgi:Ca2+/Na+ antiporter